MKDRWVKVAVVVAVIAALGSLGLSLYNTAQFNTRVKVYVQAHALTLQGPAGPAGLQGDSGAAGAEGPPGVTNLASYNQCLQNQIYNWANQLVGRLSYGSDIVFVSAPSISITCRP
jgi:hypothetical protein